MTDAARIGPAARAIRKRRGLSLEVVAGRIGTSKGHLSDLERGVKDFMVTRRGMVEDLAEVLGCSPMDLTGRPGLGEDRRQLVAASAVPALTAALHDTTLDDAPEVPQLRPLADLVALADKANAAADNVRYEPISGDKLGDLITGLHAYAATGRGDERQTALEALVTACIVARSLAGALGHGELAVTATRRGWDAARRLERLDLTGLMAMGRAISLNRLGARRRANLVLAEALADAEAGPGPSRERSSVAEARGMLHLTAAHLAARDGNRNVADMHIEEARGLAEFLGERNFMLYHFGPANVGAWEVAVAVETQRGPETAERLATVVDVATFNSADRTAAWHFDMARAYAQAGGDRDIDAIQHMDKADQLAPVRMRSDPMAFYLVEGLTHRHAKRSALWELRSLQNRYGVA
ncbi:MAG TPA: helix-turn-helix transcriptional regulator [Pseudonocardia sp.]|nr:helix-turn-helix transcriptional regulator [Pseudonocardia sp.]